MKYIKVEGEEDRIVLESKEELVCIRFIAEAVLEQIFSSYIFSFSDEEKEELASSVYAVLDEEGYGVLEACEHLN